jgi:hypothetical protein
MEIERERERDMVPASQDRLLVTLQMQMGWCPNIVLKKNVHKSEGFKYNDLTQNHAMWSV